jgi:hypothetical protein
MESIPIGTEVRLKFETYPLFFQKRAWIRGHHDDSDWPYDVDVAGFSYPIPVHGDNLVVIK